MKRASVFSFVFWKISSSQGMRKDHRCSLSCVVEFGFLVEVMYSMSMPFEVDVQDWTDMNR